MNLFLQGVNRYEIAINNSEKVNFDIISSFGKFEVNCAMTVKNLKLPTQSITTNFMFYLQKIEKDLQIDCYTNPEVKILIGQDNWHLIVTRELREIRNSNVAVSRSLLGYTIHGCTNHTLKSRRSVSTVKEILEENEPARLRGDECREEEERLEDLLKYYFELDIVGVNLKGKNTSAHEHALKTLNDTTKYMGNFWETGLLWKENLNLHYDSYNTARKRLFGIERKLDRDPVFANLYYKEIQRFIDLGYAVKVDKDEPRSKIWYLPHFGVYNINKPNKIRFVFDAAAKTNGVSFNDLVETGPDLLQNLVGVLIRFRQFEVAFSADTKDMYLRVKINKEDQEAQRFLWRGEDRNSEPDVYKMTSLIFGAKSSPCSALYVQKKNAERYEKTHPEASFSIVKNSYMDDYLSSRRTQSSSKKLIHDVIKINEEANFEMHGWVSNKPQVLENVVLKKQQSDEKEMRLCDRGGERVLGLHWDTVEDELKFNVTFSKIPQTILSGEKRPTKREFLRVMMSVFDPLGLIAPFTLKSKLIMQAIWRSGIGWDDKLRDEEYNGWVGWLSMFSVLKECRIPRCYMSQVHERNVQLHIFCDASLTAYAAVAYLRIEYENEHVDVSLVMAKSKVAPLKPLTIPRLELQAALIGARLAKFIQNELEIKISERFFWSDSSTVIRWIKSEPRTRQIYVANRLGEVNELTKGSEWFWVPTAENPADDATRYSNDAMSKNSRWFTGPNYLKLSQAEWPKDKFLNEEEKLMIDALETRKANIFTITYQVIELPVVIRLLGWRGLLIYAKRTQDVRVRLAFNKWKASINLKNSIVSVTEICENYWYRVIQTDCFESEINFLNKGKEVSKASKLSGVKPYLDDNGLLRAKGRINCLPELKFNNSPIILDSKHSAAIMLIQEYHRKFYHASSDAVLNEMRQKYYIIGLRNALRSIISKCLTCRLNRGKPQNPIMGDLPEARLAVRQRPFSHCGVDYFGPMFVKIGRRREKRWGVLFTCLTIRAIHIELAHTLSTSSAIMAIQRLAARKGVPLHMYSDNGTNFRGADNELKEAILQLDNEKINNFAMSRQIEWHFNPPDAPHMGGAWERMVRSVKTALKTIFFDQAPSEEVLYTTLCEIEHSVNSRPLTHVTLDPRDNEALTPNHFLLGTSSGEVQLGKYDSKYLCPRKQYRIAQYFADCFWKRWIREYLPNLLPRKIWKGKEPPIEEGDIVLIVDLNSPRNVWKKGTVTKLHPGKDGEVRVANVHTPTGDLLRPTRKLIKLLGIKEVQN